MIISNDNDNNSLVKMLFGCVAAFISTSTLQMQSFQNFVSNLAQKIFSQNKRRSNDGDELSMLDVNLNGIQCGCSAHNCKKSEEKTKTKNKRKIKPIQSPKF